MRTCKHAIRMASRVCWLFSLFSLNTARGMDPAYPPVHKTTYVYNTAGDRQLRLDVYHPAGEVQKTYPAILLFHGGGWVSGNRGMLDPQCKYFARHGMVAITADYRFVKRKSRGFRSTKEICIRDAKSAVRWVKSHAAMLHIDQEKLFLGGGSAGGYLATMAALDTTMNNPHDDTAVSTRVKALVLFNPAYPFRSRSYLKPFKLVSSRAPATIMFYGSNDKWKATGDSLYNLLEQHHVRRQMWIAKGQKHGFFNNPPWDTATCIKAQQFLFQCGLITRPATPPPAGDKLLQVN